MSRIVILSLASLVAVAVAALTLHDPSATQHSADGTTPGATTASTTRSAGPATSATDSAAPTRTAADSAASTTIADSAGTQPPRTAAANAAGASSPAHPASRGWSGNAVVVAFAGGLACATLLSWLACPSMRRSSPANTVLPARAGSTPDRAAFDEHVGEWQMLDSDESDLVSLHDAHGVIRYASAQLLELIGYSRQELVGLQGRDLVHQDDLPTVLAAVHAARSEGHAPPTLLRLRERGGRLLWIEGEFRHSVSRTGEPEMLCVARSIARSVHPCQPHPPRPQPSLVGAAPAPGAHPPVVAPPASGARPLTQRAPQRLDEGRGPSLQDLCHAFEQREFELHYQPKMTLAQGTVTGVEALLRWNAPEGTGRTAEIIASAERTGFIITLGEWIVRAAAHQSLQWRREGLRYPIAVNVSALQLRDPRFVPLLHELVARDRELPAWLELEVTERALAGDSDRAVRAIAQIVALGFRLHIDDFGADYSNLVQLSRMPVRALKIDRSIVRELALAGGSHDIVDAVVSLSRAMRVKVIAEGVETMAQLERLRASGCDEAQGFLLSRPMSADAVRALVLPSSLASSPPPPGESVPHETIFSPTMPVRISATQTSLAGVVGSPNSTIPSRTVPTAPIPVQTA